jgi:predicted MFS family arabinose efflux permease
VLGFGAYGLMAVAFGLLPGLWNNQIFASGYLLLNPGVLALGSVGFLSMAMRISWTQASATVFTIYMTLSNLSHVLGNWTIGPIRDDWKSPYETCFILSGCVMLLPLLLLPLIRPQQVDDAVQKDAAAGARIAGDGPG